MRGGAETESVSVESEVRWVEIHVPEVLLKNFEPMLSLPTAGHLISPIVKVEATTQLASRRSEFTLLVVDVERLHGHRPAWYKVETWVLGSNDVTMMTLDIIPPLNLSPSGLDNLDSITVRNSWEGDARDF